MTTKELIDELNTKVARWLDIGYITFNEAATLMMYPQTVGMLQLIENNGGIGKESADIIHDLLMRECTAYVTKCFLANAARKN